jgi:hypothetical protein
MIAAFLKTDDGDFNYPALLGSLFLASVILYSVLQVRRALCKGDILFTAGSHGARCTKIERAKSPTGFWCVFAIYCVSSLIFSFILIAICFGWFRKPE